MAEQQAEQSDKHEFCIPKRVVKSQEELKDWEKTQVASHETSLQHDLHSRGRGAYFWFGFRRW